MTTTRITTRLAVAAALAAPLMLGIAAQPAAAKDIQDICRNYAQRAVDDNAENVRMNCGFNGNRWNASKQFHAAWCRERKANRGKMRDQEQERAKQLQKCADKKKPRRDKKG